MKLYEFTETYYLPHIHKLVRGNTYEGYKSSYIKNVRPRFGNVELEDISYIDVQDWIDAFEKPGKACRSYSTLRQILRYATDMGVYKGDDPTKHNIRLPRTNGNTHKVLTAQEVRILLDGFKDHPLEACVLCSVSMGLRRCESFGLKWKDIDFNTGAVYVHRSRQCVRNKEVVYPTKTKKSTRICYLPLFALNRLRTIQGNAEDWLLPVPVAKAALMYRKHTETNNLPYTPFMNLRHTWATLAVESGTDVLVVANMLGHTDMQMAYKRYVKPRECIYVQAQQRYGSLIDIQHRRTNKTIIERTKTWLNKFVQKYAAML